MTVQRVTGTPGAGRSDASDRLFVRRVAAAAEAGASSRLPAALLAYAAAVALLTLVPPFLKASVGPPRAFTLQEATDLLTPLVAMPLAWLVFDLEGGLGRRGLLAFLIAAAAWSEGQGMHLAANAIGDAFPSHSAAEAFYRSVPGDLDYWLDEVLSHWMWHMAWVAVSLLLLIAATVHGRPAGPESGNKRSGQSSAAGGGAVGRGGAVSGVAGFIHGATFFIVTVEGGTAALGIPASIALLGWSGLVRRRRAGNPAVLTFFLVASLVTLAGYLGWAALHHGTLPGFYDVGLVQ